MISKIGIVCCWQGEFPQYFPLWLKSCSKNPNVEWLLFADRPPKQSLPNNVIFKKFTLEEIRDRVNKNLGIDAKGLVSPYKLCDFKPVYGIIFNEELKGYTHWGHCDIDLIWGCFNDFLSDELLEKYDKIFTKGHLGIYKNLDETSKKVFRKGSVYAFETVAKNPNFYAFDELTGIERIYKKNSYAYYSEKPYVDVSVRCQSVFLLNDKSKNYKNQAFYWEDGKVYRAYENESGKVVTDNWLYIHFQKKNPINLITNVEKVKAFWIGPNGFIEKKEETITADIIKKYNPGILAKEQKKENRKYVRKKLKEFFSKSFKDKLIHLKQKIFRFF